MLKMFNHNWVFSESNEFGEFYLQCFRCGKRTVNFKWGVTYEYVNRTILAVEELYENEKCDENVCRVWITCPNCRKDKPYIIVGDFPSILDACVDCQDCKK